MDTTAQNLGFGRTASSPRDHTAHRKVYLDTYARRRAGISEVAPEEVQPQPVITAQIKPVEQPKVIAIAVQRTIPVVEESYIQQQPAVDAFSYRPVQTAKVHATSQSEVSSQKSYLDTLTQRHQQAVAEAPVAVESVIAPTLSTESQRLFEVPTSDARLEANLRALYSDSLTDMIASDPKSASAAHVRTIVASAFACGIMAVGMFTFMGRYNSQPVVAQPIGSPVIEVEASGSGPVNAPAVDTGSAVAGVMNPEQPVRIVVSSIGVNAPVEGLGTTPEGLIAVPKAYGMVGWYNKGSVPGKPGPSVLVGHYAGGNGAVFDKLGNLNNGDLITTTNAKGQSFTYRVTAKNEYEKDKVPMAQIFKSSSESRLEIITCAGKWQSKTYNNRLVVTAELVK